MHSDNGTNFVGAEKELLPQIQELNRSEAVNTFDEQQGIKWLFQPPSAPHFGGAYETK